jgi:hypothetical protein
VEKASSLIEAEDDKGADRATSGAPPRGVVTQSGVSASGGVVGNPGTGNRASEEVSGTHPRPVRPIESGVFSGFSPQVSGDRLVDSLQTALSAASRGEAGLSSLHRSVRDASRALTASRHAHESLTEELRVLYRGLNEVMSEKAAVERYAALLTQERDAALDAAEEARREAKRDRDFLLREQDRFIQLLLEEHEAEVQQLKQRLVVRSSPPEVSSMAFTQLASLRAAEERKSAPPVASVEELSRFGTPSVPRLQLASVPSERRERGGMVETQRSSEVPAIEDGRKAEERIPTYPPPPAVLDLDSLAMEVDGNSERPPPIRRIAIAEPRLYLKPARAPSLLDTLVSNSDSSDDPSRKR